MFDFDKPVDRWNSDAWKFRELNNAFQRDDLLPMWVADMDFEVAPSITEALRQRLEHEVFGYASIPADFYPSIIRWLSRRHHLEVAPEEITFVPGVVKGIGFAINRFCKPGDAVLIQPPVYHPFRLVPEGNGMRIVYNPLILNNGHYENDFNGLEKTIVEERPKLMILCNPHNPLGRQWSADELRRVADICDHHGVIVISDEIHSDLMAPEVEHVPFFSVSDAARRVGIMMGAPSKTFNIPGIVSSWCVIKNPTLRDKFFNWLTANEFNTPTFFATIATMAAYNHCEPWLDEAIAYIRRNAAHVIERLPEISGGRITATMPDASFLLWLDCRRLGMTHDQLIDFFVNKCRLALNDGEIFGPGGEGFMRMNIATTRANIDLALDRIKKALS